VVQNGTGELVSGRVTAHIACPGLALGNDIVDSLGDSVGVVVEAKMSQKHAAAENEGGGVGLVLALDVKTDVTASWLEYSDITTHVATWDDTRTSDQSSANVGENTTVQVGHDHDVELLRTANTLHACVVDDHVVGLNRGVFLANLLDSVPEETICELHDVGLVDASDLLAVVGQRKGKRKLGNALRLQAGNDLERFDDTWGGRVLESRVFTLGVFTNDAKVNVLVAGLVAGNVLDEDNRGVNVELLAQSDVEGLVTRALDRSVQDT